MILPKWLVVVKNLFLFCLLVTKNFFFNLSRFETKMNCSAARIHFRRNKSSLGKPNGSGLRIMYKENSNLYLQLEDANTREMRLIYESQEAIRQIMQNIDNRVGQLQQGQTNLQQQCQCFIKTF